MSERRVRIVLDSKGAEKNAKSYESAMVGAGAASDKAAFSVNKLSAAIGGLITIQQVTRFVSDSIKTFGQFEQSMARVRAITRATDEQFSQMSATARELGATTEFTATQAAQGIQFLGMAGFSAADSIKAIPDVLDLATAATMDLGRAADISSNIMSAFSIASDNATQVTDVLAATASRANTDIEQLGDAMSFAGPVAQSLGVSVNDTAAAVGSLSDAGIQGGRAGTGLRRVMTSLLNPTGKAADTIKQMGLNLEELNPQTNRMVDIIGRFAEAGIDGADAMQIFGDRGGPALLALVEQYPRLVELTKGLQNVEGEAKRMAETMRDTLTGDIKTLESAFQDLQITMVSTFDERLRNSIQDATDGIRFLSDNLENIGNVVEYLSVILGTRLAVALASVTLAFAKKQAMAIGAANASAANAAATAKATAAEIAFLKTTQASLVAQLQNATAAKTKIALRAQLAANTSALTAATSAYTAAQARSNIVMTAGTKIAGGLRKALALVGGPFGVLAIAAMTLITYRSNMKDAADATDELTLSVDKLGRAEARASLMRLNDIMEEQEEKMYNAAMAINMYSARIEKLRNEGKDTSSAERELLRHQEIAEKLAKQMDETRERAKLLQNVLSNDYMVDDPFSESESTQRFQDPSRNRSDAPGRAKGEASNAELEELQAGTEQLRTQLEARLKISKMYREANLESIRNSYELEREESRIKEEEQKINLDANFENEKSKRALRFEERLNEMQLEFEAEQALRDEFKEQEKIRDAIHEEQKTAIEEKASRDREQIAKREKDAKINVYSSLATAGLSILQAFGSKSVKVQKAFAVLESGIAITAGVAKALNNPFPANLGFAAQVASQGAGLISKLKSIGENANGGAASVSMPSVGAGASSGNSDLGRGAISDTSSQRNNSTLRVSGVNDDTVLMGRTFKKIMKTLEDGGGFGRVIYGS